MITDITITSQCRLMPKMYCHSSTDSPNDAPSDASTVPTITTEAMKLRVISSMMMKMIASEVIPAISRS
nr:hypothetical protein CPGR_00589 [Mycolicibacter nonchromogenicus]